MISEAQKPLRVFCSYSHKDEEHLNDLRDWLRGLERQGLIEWWHDREIVPGWEWEEAIDKNLRTADIILLLVSPAFMASDYVFEKEIDRAIERHEGGEACVIPIIVRPADWEWVSIGKLQALPKGARPVTRWPDQDEAWLDVLRGIRRAVEELLDEHQEQAAREQYRNALEQAWEGNRVSEEEAEQLSALASELGLSNASAIEREIMGVTKEAILERQAREVEERQGHLERLYSRAHRLHQNRQWQAVIAIFEEIHSQEPDYTDSEGLLESARENLEAQKQAPRRSTSNAPQPKILISHRWADKPIADVIRRNLARWGFDDTYQLGAPGTGPRVGESLSDELREVLEDVDLVILVYTFTDEDWSWAMWEVGLATRPRQADSTRVVVFRCGRYDAPRQFALQVNVDVDFESIRDFIKHLHRNKDFFKGLGHAYRPRISDEDLDVLSKTFYDELRPVIPSGHREDRYRWDRFTLRLEPPADRLNLETDEDEVVNLIQSELFVTQPFGNALMHFGYAILEEGLKLRDLVERWTQLTLDRENVSKDWIKELCLEIRRAIEQYPAKVSWQQLNSVIFRGKAYYPVVNHVRVLPDGAMEFDVYFYDAE